jgi:Cu-Zn family superoxide dismutase
MNRLQLAMCMLGAVCAPSFSPSLAQEIATRALPSQISYPEGIAYDPKSSSFYTASAADGAVIKVNLASNRSEIILPAKTLIESAGVFPTLLGMNLDRSGRLWICGGRTSQMFVIDPAKRSVVKKLTLGTGGLLNDVAFTPDAAYVTDTLRPTLWRIETKGANIGEAEAWLDLSRTAVGHIEGLNLNGIVATGDAKRLLVGHMDKGQLFSIDTATKQVTAIDLRKEVVTGIDGLLLDGTTLYLVRQPEAEIVRIALSPDFASGKVVARLRNPALLWPSTLAKKGNELLVVNTQFNTKDKQPPRQPFTVAVIPLAKLEGG